MYGAAGASGQSKSNSRSATMNAALESLSIAAAGWRHVDERNEALDLEVPPLLQQRADEVIE